MCISVFLSCAINWCLTGCRSAKPPLPKGRCPKGGGIEAVPGNEFAQGFGEMVTPAARIPQSASLTAPFRQGSLWCGAPHKFQFIRYPGKTDHHNFQNHPRRGSHILYLISYLSYLLSRAGKACHAGKNHFPVSKKPSISARAAFTRPCWSSGRPPPRPERAWVICLPRGRRSSVREARQKP